MKIPKEAQEHIDGLNKYKENKNLETCNLIHIYSTNKFGAGKKGQSIGFIDSKLFYVWCFDFDKMEKVKLENKDELNFNRDGEVDIIRIFVDGSTLVRFKKKVKIGFGQSLNFSNIK